MKTLFATSTLCVMVTVWLAEQGPVSAQTGAPVELPVEVRTTLPTATKTYLVQRVPLGANGTEVLVHIWGATRAKGPGNMNQYTRFADSPFCVDVFTLERSMENRPEWHLTSSAAYIASSPPLLLKAHWLYPAKKQGPVLEVVFNNGAPGVSTFHNLFVWEKGFREGSSAPVPQVFTSGGLGGGSIEQKFDGVDERGTMTVRSINSYVGKVRSITTYGWDGIKFVQKP